MRRVTGPVLGLLLAVLGAPGPALADAVVAVPDGAFMACLNGLLGMDPDTPLTDAGMATLTQVSCVGLEIHDLTGAEALVNATVIDLEDNGVGDLAPLAGLASLRSLTVSVNPVEDLTPLQGLDGLQRLFLTQTQAGDLAPLAGLTSLTDLEALNAGITDVTPLGSLPALAWADLRQNHITDLSPLAGNPSLATSSCDLPDPGLCATEQTLTLPDAAVDSPYPFAVRDLAAADVPVDAAPGASYAAGALTYPAEGTFSSTWSRTDGPDADTGSLLFSGTLTQTATRPALSGPAPTVAGTPAVGRTLTASAASWGPAPVTTGWQWFRGYDAIPGATASTYTCTVADLGQPIHVQLLATKPGYADASAASAPTSPVIEGTLGRTPVPTITGRTSVGRTLTVAPGTWGPSPVTLSIQWLRDGKAVKGATGTHLRLKAAHRGHRISVAVTGRKDGFVTVTRTSVRTPVIR